MNKKQRMTLEQIFESPTRRDIQYKDVENLLNSLGAEKEERAGSRVRFHHANGKFNLHKPHPGNELKRYQVEDVRDFLILIGESP